MYICDPLLWDPPRETVASDPEQISTGGLNILHVISLQQCKNRPEMAATKTWVSAWMFSVWFQCWQGPREHKCLRAWHACTGRHRWQQNKQAWVDLTLVRCVACWRSKRGEGVRRQGWQRGSPIGPRRPFHLRPSSQYVASRRQLRGVTDRHRRLPLKWAFAFEPGAIGAQTNSDILPHI